MWPNYPVKVSVGALSEKQVVQYPIDMANPFLKSYINVWMAKDNSYINEYVTVQNINSIDCTAVS